MTAKNPEELSRSESIPVELKIQVERAVRPVATFWARKNQMREELLAHICEIYDEELSQGHDSKAAVERACQRFGDVATLTQELQQSLPAWQRWALGQHKYTSKIGRRLARQHDESQDRYEWRMLFTIGPVYFVFVSLTVLVLPLVLKRRPLNYVEIKFLVALFVALFGALFVLWRTHSRIRAEFLKRIRVGQINVRRIISYMVMMAIVVVVAAVLFWQIQFTGMEGWAMLLENWSLLRVAIAATTIPAVVVMIAYVAARDVYTFEEWGVLSIDE